MTDGPDSDRKAPRAGGPGRGWAFAVVLVLVVTAVVVLAPRVSQYLREEGVPVLGESAECVVRTPDGEVELTRDQARRATTAVAVGAQDGPTIEAPDTSDVDDTVLELLATGPADDAGPSLSCRGSAADDLPEEEITDTGLTPRAQEVLDAMTDVFGDQVLGGFAPGGVQRAGESTHNDGRAIDVFFQPVSEENRRRGWILAHWLVAHEDTLDIQYVIFDDRIWSAHSRRGRWQPYDAPEPANEILRHLDHVHVDVLRGG
ncbi:hypothetical protein ACPYO6_05995 [Georgenia sp. Z1344]|uniref:hypothetical protein n=1 Tax=Georgenia sp. Z1344 TaxID=3416706 RepID=UPI003CEC0917